MKYSEIYAIKTKGTFGPKFYQVQGNKSKPNWIIKIDKEITAIFHVGKHYAKAKHGLQIENFKGNEVAYFRNFDDERIKVTGKVVAVYKRINDPAIIENIYENENTIYSTNEGFKQGPVPLEERGKWSVYLLM